jgi:hypothetical protein
MGMAAACAEGEFIAEVECSSDRRGMDRLKRLKRWGIGGTPLTVARVLRVECSREGKSICAQVYAKFFQRNTGSDDRIQRRHCVVKILRISSRIHAQL